MNDAHKHLQAYGFTLMDVYPHRSIEWALGWNLNLVGLSLHYALNDARWSDTAYLHATQAARCGRELLEAE